MNRRGSRNSKAHQGTAQTFTFWGKTGLVFLGLIFLATGSLAAQEDSPTQADDTGGLELFTSGYVKGAGYWAWGATEASRVFPFAGLVGNLKVETDLGEAGLIVGATEGYLDLGHSLVEGSDTSSAEQYYPLGFRYNIQDRVAAELDIKELYYENTFGDFALRAGKQIIVWGQADGTNPTDILNARHIGTRSGASTDESRMGLLGLDATYYLSDGKSKIEAVFIPYSVVNDLPLPVGRIQVAPTVFNDNMPAEKPLFAPSNFEGAFRGLFAIQDWTVSLSAFSIIDRFPDYETSSAFTPPSTVINTFTPVYKRIQAYGADWATSLGGFDFRGEGLLTITDDHGGTDLYTKNSNVSGVVQLSRSWLDGLLSTGLTWVPRYIINFKPWDSYGSTLNEAAKQIYAQNGQGFEYENSIGFRSEMKLQNETLTLTGFGLYNVMAMDYLAQASLAYNLADGLNLKAGVNLYGGFRANDDLLRSFGTFGNDSANKRDNLYLELIWSY